MIRQHLLSLVLTGAALGSAMSVLARPPSTLTIARANRAATVEPDPDRFLSAIQLYSWTDGAIYRLFTSPERVSDVALQPGETLVAVAAGDTARWIIGDTESGAADSRQKHILVKPSAVGLETNLIITTDRRAYHLSLISTARNAMSAVSWSYPSDALISVKSTAEPATGATAHPLGLNIERLDFGYAISGDTPAWRPLRAFDDGQRTIIEFPASLPTSSAPPVFLINDDGQAALVNYHVQGHFYVIDRLFDVAELRFGEKHQTIVRITRNGARTRKGKSS